MNTTGHIERDDLVLFAMQLLSPGRDCARRHAHPPVPGVPPRTGRGPGRPCRLRPYRRDAVAAGRGAESGCFNRWRTKKRSFPSTLHREPELPDPRLQRPQFAYRRRSSAAQLCRQGLSLAWLGAGGRTRGHRRQLLSAARDAAGLRRRAEGPDRSTDHRRCHRARGDGHDDRSQRHARHAHQGADRLRFPRRGPPMWRPRAC